MSQLTISTELIRRLRHHTPSEMTDYCDPKLPGFVLRARPSGIHSWRVQRGHHFHLRFKREITRMQFLPTQAA